MVVEIVLFAMIMSLAEGRDSSKRGSGILCAFVILQNIAAIGDLPAKVGSFGRGACRAGILYFVSRRTLGLMVPFSLATFSNSG